jgi:hypothetical protein
MNAGAPRAFGDAFISVNQLPGPDFGVFQSGLILIRCLAKSYTCIKKLNTCCKTAHHEKGLLRKQ